MENILHELEKIITKFREKYAGLHIKLATTAAGICYTLI